MYKLDAFSKQIGAKIAYQRCLRGYTQAELAEKSNISLATLGKIERGRYNGAVSFSRLFAIAEGLQVDVMTILCFTDAEKAQWYIPDAVVDPKSK